MFGIEFPFTATIIGGVIAYIFGIFWYHPKVMGTKWMEARGKAAGQSQPEIKQYIFTLILWFIAACFYSYLVQMIGIQDVAGFLSLSCLLWVAFAMPPIVMGSLYTNYSFNAAAIDAAYQLGGYYILGLVHAALILAL